MGVKSFVALTPRVNVIKLFCLQLMYFRNKLVSVQGKPFQPDLMFVCKVRSLTLSGEHVEFFNRVGFCFTNKHYTRLESLGRDKHSSLLRAFVNYGQKLYTTLATGADVIKHVLSVIYRFSHYARVFIRLGWKSLPSTNALAYYEHL